MRAWCNVPSPTLPNVNRTCRPRTRRNTTYDFAPDAATETPNPICAVSRYNFCRACPASIAGRNVASTFSVIRTFSENAPTLTS